ncbi:hypothetical protein [Nocardia sp. NPDC058497]
MVRRQLADGITETEFATLTGTLARMIANLEQPVDPVPASAR